MAAFAAQQLSNYNRDYRTHKAKNICYLAPYKSLLSPVLEDRV